MDLRQNAQGAVFAAGLTKVAVDSIEQVFEICERGAASRATCATELNELSSRSHSILLVEVVSSTTEGTQGLTTSTSTGKLFLVDLAGSERVAKSKVSGQTLKETQNINRSLAALGNSLSTNSVLTQY